MSNAAQEARSGACDDYRRETLQFVPYVVDSLVSFTMQLLWLSMRPGSGVGGSRCAPSVVTFNTLISACGKARYLDQARKLLARMHEVALTPDAFTIASFVAAAGEQSCWQEAKSTFDCFVAEGGRPTRIAYNALVSSLR